MTGESSNVLTVEYTQALAAGHSWIKIKPDPELLALADPYDPELNRGVRLLDAALYRGRYYVYYGLTPFVTVLVPWFWFTGRVLAESKVVTGYAIGSAVFVAFFLWDVCRRYLPRTTPWLLAVAVLASCLSSGLLLLIRNPRIYELVIAAACFHDCVTLVCCHLAFTSPRHERLWLSLAALNAGLTVAARPSQLPVAIAVAAIIAHRNYQRRGTWGDIAIRSLRDGAPLVVVALSLAFYNWVRFDNPLSFGYRYLLVDVKNFGETSFSPRYCFFNLWHYLVGIPRGSGWFPFFEWTREGWIPMPSGYYSLNQVYGTFVVAPYILCGFGFVFLRARSSESLSFTWKLALALGGANLAILSMLDGATYRYTPDFLTFWCLSGSLGLLAIADQSSRAKLAEFASYAGATAALIAIASSICAGFALYDLARQNNAADFARAARIFNQPRIWWEAAHRTGLPAYRARTTLPQNQFGHAEPLLVTGRPGLHDFIYLFYTAPGLLQVGFEAIGRGGPVSAPVEVDYTRPVELDLALGWEWPPEGAVPYSGLDAERVENLRRTLIVRINGQVAIEAYVSFHPVSGFHHWGESPDNSAFGRKYSGAPLQVSSITFADRAEKLDVSRPSNYGALRLKINRTDAKPGQKDPLIVMGYRNRFQAVGLVHESDSTVRFFARSSEESEIVSDPIRFSSSADHELAVKAGGLFPPARSVLWDALDATDVQSRRNRLQIVLDGTVVWEAPMPAPEIGPNAVIVAKNTIGLSDMSSHFDGEIRVLGRGKILDDR